MIGRLSGRIVEDGADGVVVLDVAGVGYELMTPLGALGRAAAMAPAATLGPDDGGAVTLYVHTHVREDALSLYGFPSRDDRAAFRTLIGISNIGPKIGLAILGSLTTTELADAIARGDVARLTKIPGVGKRTAERIVLELKGKLLAPSAPTAAPARGAAPASSAKNEVLRATLTNLGFKGAEAERAIAALGARVDAEPIGELVRAALGMLAR